MTRDRGFAAAAGCTVLAGAVTMLAGLVAAPGSWLTGYVSEAGTAGRPSAVAYSGGLILLAAGVALLAGELRPVRAAAPLLAAAAVLAATSAAVPCSRGCPLPPYEPTTVADVLHTAASIGGLFALAAAMVAVAVARGRRPVLRRLAAGAATLTVPLGAVLGLIMLVVGRGPVSAALERMLLVVAVGWLVGTAVVAALPARTNRQAGGRRPPGRRGGPHGGESGKISPCRRAGE